MSEKENYKLEKKRIKAELKLKKKEMEVGNSSEGMINNENLQSTKTHSEIPQKEIPWYKNPDWIRAIAAVVGIILMVIGLLITI